MADALYGSHSTDPSARGHAQQRSGAVTRQRTVGAGALGLPAHLWPSVSTGPGNFQVRLHQRALERADREREARSHQMEVEARISSRGAALVRAATARSGKGDANPGVKGGDTSRRGIIRNSAVDSNARVSDDELREFVKILASGRQLPSDQRQRADNIDSAEGDFQGMTAAERAAAETDAYYQYLLQCQRIVESQKQQQQQQHDVDRKHQQQPDLEHVTSAPRVAPSSSTATVKKPSNDCDKQGADHTHDREQPRGPLVLATGVSEPPSAWPSPAPSAGSHSRSLARAHSRSQSRLVRPVHDSVTAGHRNPANTLSYSQSAASVHSDASSCTNNDCFQIAIAANANGTRSPHAAKQRRVTHGYSAFAHNQGGNATDADLWSMHNGDDNDAATTSTHAAVNTGVAHDKSSQRRDREQQQRHQRTAYGSSVEAGDRYEYADEVHAVPLPTWAASQDTYNAGDTTQQRGQTDTRTYVLHRALQNQRHI